MGIEILSGDHLPIGHAHVIAPALFVVVGFIRLVRTSNCVTCNISTYLMTRAVQIQQHARIPMVDGAVEDHAMIIVVVTFLCAFVREESNIEADLQISNPRNCPQESSFIPE